MLDLTAAEFLGVVLPILCLGVYAVRQEIRTHRWDPGLFRNGLCVFREKVPLAVVPSEVALPSFAGGSFLSSRRAKRLGPREVAFLVPTLNFPVMRGLLRYDPESRSLEVVGHLQIAFAALFGLGFAVSGLLLALPLVGLLVAWGYRGERESFQRVLMECARSV